MKTLNLIDIKKRVLIAEAEAWLGVSEQGGNNRGQVIEIFQKTVDNRAVGEPWCMGFVQYCLMKADKFTNKILDYDLEDKYLNQLFKTEHCVTCWLKSPVECRLDGPEVGSIVIWQKRGSMSGHTGLVVTVDRTNGFIWTIEGNTGPMDKEINREGDGVYLKKRSLTPAGSLQIKGFLNPWPLGLSISLQ